MDLALARAKPHARFVMCGGISQYNTKDVQGVSFPLLPLILSSMPEPSANHEETEMQPKNYLMIVSMRIRMQGFIVTDYEKQFGAARRELSQWLAEGKIKRQETVVKGGLKEAEKALVGLYKGLNTGKLLVEVAADRSARI